MSTYLERFRDHARAMSADSAHLVGCESLNKPRRKMPIWLPERVTPSGFPVSLVFAGWEPDYAPPACHGCVPDAERALWGRLADEVDRWLTEGLEEAQEPDEPLWGHDEGASE